MKLRYLTGTCILLAVSVAYGRDLPNYQAYDQAPRRTSAPGTVYHVPGKVVSVDDKRGVPTFVWAHPRKAVKSTHATPEMAARWYVSQFASAYGLTRAALGTVYVSRVQDMGPGGVIVFLRQRVDGVEVVRNELKVLMKQDKSLVALGGNLHHAATPGQKSFRISGEEALARAFGNVHGTSVSARVFRATGKAKAGYDHFELAATSPTARAGLSLAEPARVRKVLYPLPDRLEPGYIVEIISGKAGEVEADAYAYVIGARDGSVLMRQNLTQKDSFDYRVWAESLAPHTPLDGPQADYTPHPTGMPDLSEPTFVPPGTVSMEGFNTSTPSGLADPWLPAGAIETLGNNVDAYADLVSPDGFTEGQDLRANTTATNVFDYVYDTAALPNASQGQIKAAVTQLFYTVNWLHDYFYDSGFHEAAGNGQDDNYGRGGVAGDRVHAQAQDYTGRNNANMRTPLDGTSPRMQMYVWDGKTLADRLEANGSSYEFVRARFGARYYNVTANLVLADDGTDQVNDGCTAITNSVAGAIALMDRGNCDFAVKAKNAETAGALGVIIANHIAGDPPPLMGHSNPPITVVVPSLAITYEDGQTLRNALLGGPVSVTMERTKATDRDGTIDNGIVAHEWGHYMHHRLTECGTAQCAAQSEGWGDFIALHMIIRKGDDYAGAYAVAGYATSVLGDSSYYGIRRVPYSVDTRYNALTFRHVVDGEVLPESHPVQATSSPNSEIHNAGEIWTTILLEGYVALLEQSQGQTPVYSFEEAKRRMANYIVAGMQLAPVDPTFNEQLDAILAAAYARDVSDYNLLTAAFARRGAGSCARSPARSSLDFVGVVEDFQVRGAMEVTSVEISDEVLSCDMDGYLDESEKGRVKVRIDNVGDMPLEGTTVTLSSQNPAISFPGGASVTVPMIQQFDGASLIFDIAVARALDTINDMELTVTVSNPDTCETTVTHVSTRAINFDFGPTTVDPVESPTSPWLASGTPAEVSWTQLENVPGNHVWHGIDAGAPSEIVLISPTLVVSATDDLVLTFDHRYSFEYDPDDQTYFDGGVIEISQDDGATWEDISVYASPSYDGMVPATSSNPLAGRSVYGYQNSAWPGTESVTLNLGTVLAGKLAKVRFRIGTDQNAGDHGWEIDNIAVQGIINQPFLGYVADAGLCNGVPLAVAGSDQTVESGALVTLSASESIDPDGDAIAFQWSQEAGPSVALMDSNTATSTFTAPVVAQDTVLVFDVSVNDGYGSSMDTVQVTVLAQVNMEPDAGPSPDAGAPIDGGGGGGCCQASSSLPTGSAALALLTMLALMTMGMRRRPTAQAARARARARAARARAPERR